MCVLSYSRFTCLTCLARPPTRYSEYSDILNTYIKMKFLGQYFRQLEPEQNRHVDHSATNKHTDRRDRTHYHAIFADNNDQLKV